MSAGTLEELIDENHVIVSPSVGPEYDISIFSLVYKDQLEPGCAILMHNKIAGTFRERRYLVTSYGCILTTWMGFGVLRLTKGCIVAACLFGVALANYA